MGVVRGTSRTSGRFVVTPSGVLEGSDDQRMEGRSAGAKGFMLSQVCISLSWSLVVDFEKTKQSGLPWRSKRQSYSLGCHSMVSLNGLTHVRSKVR